MGLISKTVKIKWNPSNKKWFENKGYIFTKFKDEFEVKVEDLTDGNEMRVSVKCDDCGKQIIKKYYNYNRDIKLEGKCMCKRCKVEANKDEIFKNMKETYKNKTYPSKNIFRLSDDGTYWVGVTQKGEEFWFDGNPKTIEYIKSYTWRKTTYNYFQNRKGDKLHRIVMGITNPNIIVNHLGGNRWDNRMEKLSISDDIDNSKEKQTNGRSGIVGLMERGRINKKWVAMVTIDGLPVNSKYKTRDEALIDLLIIQRHYGFRHNEDLYYMLNNVSELRVKEVLNNIERQLTKKRDDKISSTNRFELSEDKTFYWVYNNNENKNINKFKISLENKSIIEKGIWYIAEDKHHDKLYVHGTIIVDGVRKIIRLHRYLMDMLDIKYKNWYIDHLNGDALDNRIENLVITDAQGNGTNKPVKGYVERYGRWRVKLTIFGENFSATVDTEKEAIELVKQKREESMKRRLEFHNKEELDTYLHNQELVQAC